MPNAKIEEICSNLDVAQDLVLRALQILQGLPENPLGSAAELQSLHFRIRSFQALLCLSNGSQHHFADRA
jgi:hypothetical protein